MAPVEVKILQPANGLTTVGPAPVKLKGELVSRPAEIADVPLYYHWYSSLRSGPEEQLSINDASESELSATLGVGTHVLTFAASDQSMGTATAQIATLHGGVTGGSEGPAACVIHVLLATIVSPLDGATLSKASATLDAEAPWLWDDVEYTEHNRLAFRWRLDPTPADGRAAGKLPPAGTPLVFEKATEENKVPVLRYHGPLPATLGLGAYRLTLRVERTDDATVGHESWISVVIVP